MNPPVHAWATWEIYTRDREQNLDETEFLSEYGIRALSRYHHDHPFIFNHAGQEFRVDYLPGDSNTGMFGGNSNWRGLI